MNITGVGNGLRKAGEVHLPGEVREQDFHREDAEKLRQENLARLKHQWDIEGRKFSADEARKNVFSASIEPHSTGTVLLCIEELTEQHGKPSLGIIATYVGNLVNSHGHITPT